MDRQFFFVAGSHAKDGYVDWGKIENKILHFLKYYVFLIKHCMLYVCIKVVRIRDVIRFPKKRKDYKNSRSGIV